MAHRVDPTFIPSIDHKRMHNYENTEKNIYDRNPEAKEAMEERIRRHPRFNVETGQPHPCTCDKKGEGARCKLGSCETHDAGFECPLSCAALLSNRPCVNREIAFENFESEVFDIRAHLDPEKGLGLFATTDIKAGTYLGEVKGVLGMGDVLPNQYCFEIGKDFQPKGQPYLYLDLCDTANEFRYVNTCCTPNSELISKAIGLEFHLALRTTKKIHEDEEITVPYSDQMLNFINIHICNKQRCLIKQNVEQRLEEAGFNPAVERRRLSRGALNATRFDVVDEESSHVFFQYPGLGPILGTGMIYSRPRRIPPTFHIPEQQVPEDIVPPENPQPLPQRRRLHDADPRAAVSGVLQALQPPAEVNERNNNEDNNCQQQMENLILQDAEAEENDVNGLEHVPQGEENENIEARQNDPLQVPNNPALEDYFDNDDNISVIEYADEEGERRQEQVAQVPQEEQQHEESIIYIFD